MGISRQLFFEWMELFSNRYKSNRNSKVYAKTEIANHLFYRTILVGYRHAGMRIEGFDGQ